MNYSARSIIGIIAILITVGSILVFTGDNSANTENITNESKQSVKMRKKDITQAPEGKEILPQDLAQDQLRQAPPEALAACVDLSEDAECSFSGGMGDVSGICVQISDSELACAPEKVVNRR